MGLMLLAAGAAFGQISIGIQIGAPPPVRVMPVVPRSPGPEYVWIGGYWYPVGHKYKWHDGYWTRPAFSGARWVAPRYEGRMYYEGYWDGGRGPIRHDHKWDKEKNRGRGKGRNRDYGHDH